MAKSLEFLVTDAEELKHRISGIDKDGLVASVAVRPNGELHLGHLVTIAGNCLAVKKASEQAGKNIRYFFIIEDLDTSLDIDYSAKELRYLGKSLRHSEPDFIANCRRIEKAVGMIAEKIGADMQVIYESELYKRQDFAEYIGALRKQGKIGSAKEKLHLYSRCDGCDHYSVIEPHSEDHDYYLASCLNTTCDKARQSNAAKLMEIDWCSNLIDGPPLNDEYLGVDIHLIGGDHVADISNPDDSMLLMHDLRVAGFHGRIPIYFSINQTVYKEGQKMSKSLGNTISALEFMQDPNWPEKLKILMNANAEKIYL